MSDTATMADDVFETSGRTDPRDEPLPFLSNFQDVFLTTGVVALLVGLVIGGVSIAEDLERGGMSGAALTVLIALPIGGAVWGLSEVLVRARRRVLPGIVLCLAFLACLMAAFGAVYAQLFEDVRWDENPIEAMVDAYADEAAAMAGGTSPDGIDVGALRAATNEAAAALPWVVKLLPASVAAMGLVGALLYYRRFRLPFASALVAAGAVSVVLALLFLAFPFDLMRGWPSAQLLVGLAFFAAGLAYDMKDPERVTRFAGNGFWLHLLAAPVLLGGALSVVQYGPLYDLADFDLDAANPFSLAQSLTTLAVIAAFGLVSLLINRRALVVSGLVSAGVAIGVIVAQLGLGSAGVAAATLVLLGGGVVLLGVGWNAARRALLAPIPAGGVLGRAFPRGEADG